MKKILITIVFLFTVFSLSATDKGFKAKIYNEENVHFMNISVDYVNNKVKIITDEFTLDYYLLHNYATVDKSILYLGVLQVQLYNNGNFDSSKEETLIFNLKKSTFSTSISKREFKCEFFQFE